MFANEPTLTRLCINITSLSQKALEYIADVLKDDPEVLLAALSSMDRKT